VRTVLLATSYPSTPGDAAGHFVRAEALWLAREGYEVHVIAPAPRGDPGVAVHAAGSQGLFSWPGAAARAREQPLRLALAPAFGARASWLLRRLSPCRLVAHWVVPSGWPLALAAGQADVEVVSHGADARLLLALPGPMRERVVGALLRRGVRFRFVASCYRDALLAALSPALSRSLDGASRVEPPRVEVGDLRGNGPREARVLALARLVPDKRIHLAIEAIAQIPGVPLIIAGEGPERLRLEQLARRLAPGRVHFVGQIPRPEALGWIASSAVLVHPSAVEAAPTAVLEALALSTPVVACEAGDLALWARSMHGLSLAAAHPDDLAAAITRALGAEGVSPRSLRSPGDAGNPR
jgi:glycosyltransferase involved in cell wall biosynthesis